MPLYQNSSVTTNKLIIGNVKMEVAASAAATFTNVGAGIVNDFVHETEMYEVQAGNAPDPLEGVAEETIKITGEMIEYDSSVLNIMHGGLIASSTSSSVETIHAGGNATISERAYKFTNTRYISSVTIQTILTVYKATLDAGPSFQLKSDNDADPIMVMPFAITGKIDATLTVGQQLYKLTRDVPS